MEAATKKSRATRAKTSERESIQTLEETTKKAKRKTSKKNEEQAAEAKDSTVIAAPAAQAQPDGASTTPKSEFGAWLRREREARGLTQARAAQTIGIHVNQLARIEKGDSGTKQATAAAFARAFSLDEAEVLKRAGLAAPTAKQPTKGEIAKTNGKAAKTTRLKKQPEPQLKQQQSTAIQTQEQPSANGFLDRETMLASYRTM